MPMEELTPEELEQFLARARAQGRLLTPEERAQIFGNRVAPAPEEPALADSPDETVKEMKPALLEPADLARLQQNFYPELADPHQPAAPSLVRGVIFDFDDTLAYLSRPLDELMAEGARAAEAYMRSTGMDLPPEFWSNIIEARRFAEEKSEEENEEHLADDALSFLLQFFGYPASKLDRNVLTRAVDIFYAPEMSAWRLHENARAVLQALHDAGFKLAVLANYSSDRIFQRMVDYLGVRPYLHFCLASASVEHRKPDERLFNLVLERWDALPYEVVVVGDSLRHDIQGGIELGALTIQCALGTSPQVTHDNASLAAQVKADAVVHDLAAIPALIREWAR